ncbi:hypothetical protein XI07_15735 [Bradyrhizobium sp. CCBAU 11445]|nr:hypothetical protein [Bradyrhizobium sp. CCBAU 11445]MDA9523327.1 hypothetical protein [Bradyrhizobium sp. CCBAU 11434]
MALTVPKTSSGAVGTTLPLKLIAVQLVVSTVPLTWRVAEGVATASPVTPMPTLPVELVTVGLRTRFCAEVPRLM